MERYTRRATALPSGRKLMVPVWREILFDRDTAVTALAKIEEPPFSFLLESVIGGETWARYTFMGTNPRAAWRIEPGGMLRTWSREAGWQDAEHVGDPLQHLSDVLTSVTVESSSALPRFIGGAVGFLGYDTIRYVEHLPDPPHDDVGWPDAVLMFTDAVIAIDNVFGKAQIIALAELDEASDAGLAYDRAAAEVERLIARLEEPSRLEPVTLSGEGADPNFESSYQRHEYEQHVQRIREYIAAGDAFQVVLSQRLSMPLHADPFDVYRALRSVNPSPYLYYLRLDEITIVGSSPEVLVRVDEGKVIVRPIAGTRPRGANQEEDERLAQDLLADPKERAEHLMLVDLGRNDVGRTSRFGTVKVSSYMNVERYSHVLHLVSQVEGELRGDLNAIDVLRTCAPAGTVSGAPKVRAMQIIDELEPVRRGPYAGAVGYIAYGAQSLDTAIAIRTLIAREGRAFIQAGAGIVADSVPSVEYEETLAKARALLRVIHRLNARA